MIIPAATVFAGVVDFGVAFGVLHVLMLGYGIAPTFSIIWTPAFLLLTLITSLGISLWYSTLNVEYRDTKTLFLF